MSRRTVLVAVGLVVVAAAAVVGLIVFTGSDSAADPNETAVTDLCRDAAEEQPFMTDGRMNDFAVDEMTHESSDGITFYRALGTARASDGYGGENTHTFECKAKLVADGERWELIDIFVM